MQLEQQVQPDLQEVWEQLEHKEARVVVVHLVFRELLDLLDLLECREQLEDLGLQEAQGHQVMWALLVQLVLQDHRVQEVHLV